MDRDSTYLTRQRKLSQEIRTSITTLYGSYLDQIQLTTRWLIDQKLDGIRQSDELPCSALDRHLLEEFNHILAQNSPKKLQEDLQRLQSEIRPEQHDPQCSEFWSVLIRFIADHGSFIEELMFSTDPISSIPAKSSQLSNLDRERVYRTMIDPLSNLKRLDILQAIQEGNVRFKDLEEALELRAGHLLYHLNPLKEANYVSQDDQKNYSLSSKGELMLNYLLSLYYKFED